MENHLIDKLWTWQTSLTIIWQVVHYCLKGQHCTQDEYYKKCLFNFIHVVTVTRIKKILLFYFSNSNMMSSIELFHGTTELLLELIL